MPYGAYGLRRLIDSSQRFLRAGLPFYLRKKAFADNAIWADLGLVFVPTAPGALTGTVDYQVRPQPSIKLVSMHSIAKAQEIGVELRAGARKVQVSHTWVKAMQRLWSYSTPEQVWKDPSTVGIVTDNLLLEIMSYTHTDAFGEILEWNLLCNSSEFSGA